MRLFVSVLGTLSTTFLLTSAPVVQAAGFDCKKATTDVEKLICKNHELSEFDSRLSSVYRQILDTTDTEEAKKRVKSAQQAWLSKTRDICRETSCLLYAYRQRIDVLEKAYFDFSRSLDKYSAFVRIVEDEPSKAVRTYGCQYGIGTRGGIFLSYTGDKLSDLQIDHWMVSESPDLRNGYTWGLVCEAKLTEFDLYPESGNSPAHKVMRLLLKSDGGLSNDSKNVCTLIVTDSDNQLRLEAINPSKCSQSCISVRMVLDKKLQRCRILEL